MKKIGIALSGGGARGLAHVGVLEVFEKHGIPISIISGTSMGAMIGGAYAAGKTIAEIKAVVARMGEEKVIKWSNFNFLRESLLKAKKIRDYAYELVGEALIEQARIPFIAMATDLESGSEVRLKEGKLCDAIMASTAYPPLFPPVFFNNRYLIDGGLLNVVPVDVIRPQADIAIAVNLKNYTSQQFISGMIYDKYYRKPPHQYGAKHSFLKQWELDVLLMENIVVRTIDIAREENMERKLTLSHPDILITPEVELYPFFGFKDYEKIIAAGASAAEEMIPKIKTLLG